MKEILVDDMDPIKRAMLAMAILEEKGILSRIVSYGMNTHGIGDIDRSAKGWQNALTCVEIFSIEFPEKNLFNSFIANIFTASHFACNYGKFVTAYLRNFLIHETTNQYINRDQMKGIKTMIMNEIGKNHSCQ